MPLSSDLQPFLAFSMFLAAALYTSVGHGGASGYLALMALFGIEPAIMRPTALVLNVLVASFTSFRYLRVGFFRWRTFWPVASGALPMAFVGGTIELPVEVYRPLVGVLLLVAAARLLWPKELSRTLEPSDPPVIAGILVGVAIGLLSGLTGTGGGIFLSPILLFLGWSSVRIAVGVVAVFILGNSLAGLAGNYTIIGSLPPNIPIFAAAVLAGAIVGTTLGVRIAPTAIMKALGVVLVIAGFKMALV